MYQSRNVISDEPAAWCTLWVEQRCMCPDLVCAQHTKLLTPMAEPLAAVLFVIYIYIFLLESLDVDLQMPELKMTVEVVPLDDVLSSSWSSFRQHVGICRGLPWKQTRYFIFWWESVTVILIQGEGGKRDRQDGLPSRTGQSSWAFHLSHVILAMPPRRWLSYNLKV